MQTRLANLPVLAEPAGLLPDVVAALGRVRLVV